MQGDFMRNKLKKCICYILIMISIFLLSGCSNQTNEESLKTKLASEMKYFDSTISNMLNYANGLTFENYLVSAEKIENTTQSEQNSEQQGQQSGQNSESSSSSQEGSKDSQSQSSSSDSSSSSENKNNYQYKIVENSILIREKTPDWNELTKEVENLYSNWAIITLDLYKENIDSQKILVFNTDLDSLTKAIKDKNKEQTLQLLAKLYAYIPSYSSDFSDDQLQNNLYKVKSNVFNAYSIIEQNNLNEVKKQLQLAEEAMIAMMNNMQNKNEKQYNMNKAYILLKDLQNTLNKNDTDIFYLKYKNLMQELNVL